MVQRKVMEVISVSHKLMLSVYEFEFETVPVFFRFFGWFRGFFNDLFWVGFLLLSLLVCNLVMLPPLGSLITRGVLHCKLCTL